MTPSPHMAAEIPLLQRSIRNSCFHPSGVFEEFKSEDTEQSIPDRFEKQVASFPDRVAIRTRGDTLTFDSVDMALVVTQNRAKKAEEEELARMLSEVERFSEEEAMRQLADETQPNAKK